MDLAREMESRCKINEASNADVTATKNHKINKQEERRNNNDEEYENGYNHELHRETSGRISGGSRESAFSSSSTGASDAEEETGSSSGGELDSSSGDNNSSSGRSSAHRDSDQDINQAFSCRVLNPHTNIMPEKTECLALIEDLRVQLLDCLRETAKRESKQLDEMYDSIDLDELQKPIVSLEGHEQSLAFRLISRFINFKTLVEVDSKELRFSEKEANETIDKIVEMLKFRHHYRLSSVMVEDFSKEFYLLNGIFKFGYDKNQLPVLYLRARIHRRWSFKMDEVFRRFVAWQIDTLTKSNVDSKVIKSVGYRGFEKDGSFAICFDCLHVSYSCIDMDFLRFLVRVMVQYYPSYCRYALCVDLPWLFRSVWKLVQTWLPEDARNTVQLITSKQLTDYIDVDQIPNSVDIGIEKSPERRHKYPENFESLREMEDFAQELDISPKELKQFKAHVDKMCKEYEQLGAL